MEDMDDIMAHIIAEMSEEELARFAESLSQCVQQELEERQSKKSPHRSIKPNK